jgi:hypothetical protein
MGSVNNVNRFLNIEDSHLRVVSGNVYAQALNVGGITVGAAHGLQSVSDVSNTTSNTLQFTNATTSFKATSNIEIGGDVSYTSKPKISVESNVVAEYTGPHDRPLRKYPEVAMTADDNLSTSGYKASVSSLLTGSDAFKAFDATGATSFWHSQYPYYTFVTGTYNPGQASQGTGTPSGTLPTTELISGHQGEWIKLQMPKKIKLEEVRVYASNRAAAGTNVYQMPKDIAIAGSNDGTNWYLVDSGTLRTGIRESYGMASLPVTTSSYYSYLALIVKTTDNQGANYSAIEIANIEYYGHEEGSGSLDTTLKSVYNVPATTGTQLEVYYDAKDLADGAVTSVTDLSPNSNGGLPSDSPQVSNGAFVFDGVNDYIYNSQTGYTGGNTYTGSAWIKKTANIDGCVFQFGNGSNGNSFGIFYYGGSIDYIRAYVFGYAIADSNSSSIPLNEWIHVTGVYSDKTATLYINGIEVVTNTGSTGITIPSTPYLTLGAQTDNTNTPYGGTYFTGSIANFRLYSKALNADQVKELYDYQKDYFLGSKSQVTLYKGHLGVGVTEPSGQLELAGDERIQEYPPGIMNINETLIPGHGIFKARSSTSSTIDERNPWAAFNKSTAQGWDSNGSISDYSTIDGSYTSNEGNTLLSNGSNYSGEFLEIELPYPIKLKTNYFYPQQNTAYGTPRFFREALVLGSNNGHTWDILQSISETSYSYTYVSEEYLTVNTNSETYYKYFRVAVNKVIGGTNGNRVNINEWRLFGTPGPTTLDKGSLSLTRSLDVPRVSRYDVDTETPRPEKLVLDFDTTVNSSPTDISGKGNHGKFVNGASYSPADKAFTFDGTTDTIEGEISGISGDYVHSISFWGNFNATNQTVFEMGSRSDNDLIGINYTTGSLKYYFYANDYVYNGATQLYAWNHFVFTYSGGGTSRKVFLNGVELGLTSSNGAAVNQSLTLANGNYSIGDIVGSGSGSGDVNGKISNFKLYSVALEPSEVKKLYNLGRTGRSMVISDTAVGIGKVPEAQLDVRGVGKFDAVGIGDGVTNGRDTSMSAPLCVLTDPTLRGQSSWDLNRSIAKFGYQNGSNHYGISFSVNANNGHGLIQTYNQNGGGAQYELHLQPAGGVTTTNGSTVTSDDRVKVDETFIVNATETLMKLRPQTYTRYAMMVDETRPNLDSWRRYEAGLVTQEVYYDAPELRHIVNVSDDADLSGEDIRTSDDPIVDPDYRNWGSSVSSLDYIQLIPYLIKSNQEQEEEIRVLSAIKEAAFLQTSQITLLQNVVFSLTKRIEALENA